MIQRLLPRLLLALLTVLNGAWAEDEILAPDLAFKFSVHLADADTVEWRYTIAEGYYLYRDKFAFSSETPGVSLGAPQLPAGKIIHDEFFGRVETYRGELVIRVPLTGADKLRIVALKTQFQGCADAGICYTPQVRHSTLQLASAQEGERVRGGSALSRLKSQPVGATETAPDQVPEGTLLPVEQAFKVRVIAQDGQSLRAVLSPAPAYYLVRDQIKLTVDRDSDVRITQLVLPRGTKKHDPTLGDVEVYQQDVIIEARLARLVPEPRAVDVRVQFAGCGDGGGCYPLTTHRQRVTLAALTHVVDNSATPAPANDVASSNTGGTRSELDPGKTTPANLVTPPAETASKGWLPAIGYWGGALLVLLGVVWRWRVHASKAAHRNVGH